MKKRLLVNYFGCIQGQFDSSFGDTHVVFCDLVKCKQFLEQCNLTLNIGSGSLLMECIHDLRIWGSAGNLWNNNSGCIRPLPLQ